MMNLKSRLFVNVWLVVEMAVILGLAIFATVFFAIYKSEIIKTFVSADNHDTIAISAYVVIWFVCIGR
jgi:hypothetical protein